MPFGPGKSLRSGVVLAVAVVASAAAEPGDRRPARPRGDPCLPTLITTDVALTAMDTQYDGTVLTIRGATVTLAGSHTFCRLSLQQGAVLTHAAADTGGVDVDVTESLFIDASSSVDVNRKGWPHRTGPGAPPVGTSGGGGHAGRGGAAGNGIPGGMSYGSWQTPAHLGSGGGGASGGSGGGWIRLSVLDTLEVNGAIEANGGDAGLASHGGGAGGSIHLMVGTLTGSGTIATAGGVGGTGGGGGGGRIALEFGSSSFTGTTNAVGGVGGMRGGAGTIFTRGNGARAELRVVNAGLPVGARTDLFESLIAADVVISSGAVVDGFESTVIEGDLRIEADAFVSRDGSGYGAGQGPGAGTSGSGAGYGGAGGNSTVGAGAGSAYGSRIFPIDPGSGGAGQSGGHGGGRILLNVLGTLTLDGALSAHGGDPGLTSHGAGAGGTIRLNVGGLEGGGSIAAHGGAAVNGGGGGGGRVALYSPDCFFSFDVASQVSVTGGAGFNPGQVGTTFFGYGHVAAAGSEDAYALPADPAAPSADLVAALAPAVLVNFDEDPSGQALAHTFVALPPTLAAAKLALRLRATTSNAEQDQLTLAFADGVGFHPQWSRYLGSTNGTADPGLMPQPWTSGSETTLVLDLAQLPLAGGGSLELSADLAQQGLLDVVVEHFTQVDFALLTHCTNDLTAVHDGAAPSFAPTLLVRTTPNPFNPRVTFSFELRASEAVQLTVYDLRGRKITDVVRARLEAGRHDVVFDAGHLASGVYLARLLAGADIATARVTLLK